jgi:saccharopine dehydrogenase (NAD+, L-lysine-forming)
MWNKEKMKIGILSETKIPVDTRVPLTPEQCRMITKEFTGIEVYVQPSSFRCYTDAAYRKEGISVTKDLSDCDVLLGIKEVNPDELIAGKTYLFFSHTIKKQEHNRKLLKTILEKHVRLVDYEMLTDSRGVRIIGFGRWAGLIGSYAGIRALCIRMNIPGLPPVQECRDFKDMITRAANVHLPNIRIAVTGDGRVAGGAEEMLGAFGIQKVTVNDFLTTSNFEKPVYVQLDPEKYNKRKNKEAFDLYHFFSHPRDYESNFLRFCNLIDMLIMAAYWDPHAPVLFTLQQMRSRNFRAGVIADITCDMHGAIPSTVRVTNFQAPYYDFNPFTGLEEEAFSNNSNITVMSVDNLPSGLPKEASTDFGHNLIKNVFSLLTNGDPERIIERATLAEKGHLTSPYQYLAKWVNQQE